MPLLRAASGPLIAALAGGSVLYKFDLFVVTLVSGQVGQWHTGATDLVINSAVVHPGAQFASAGKLKITNTMQVPELEIKFLDTTQTAFTATGAGGTGTALTFRQAIHAGLFDGCAVLYARWYLGPDLNPATLGPGITLFVGDGGRITNFFGAQATLLVRGKSNRLNVAVPKNVYQPACIHTFCDPGCTLSAASFTGSTAVAASPATTRTFLAFAANPNVHPGGTITMTSGVTAGEVRGIIDASISGVTLAYSLTAAPAIGDTFTVFQACNKTISQCNLTYANLANFRGFPYIPPPDTVAP